MKTSQRAKVDNKTPAESNSPAKDGTPETTVEETPPLRESTVRKIVDESIANFQQRIGAKIENSIAESVKTTFSSFSTDFMKNFEGKLKNQRELIVNVKNQMSAAREEIEAGFSAQDSQQAKEDGEILRSLSAKLLGDEDRLHGIQDQLADLNKELRAQREPVPADDEDADAKLPPIDAEGAAQAAVSLASISTNISKMSDSLLAALEKVSGMGPCFQDVPDKINAASDRLNDIATRLSSSISSFTAPDGAMERFSKSASQFATMASDSVDRLTTSVSGAETRLSEKQKTLEDLVRRLSNGLDAPRMIRDEVVPKLGSFFDNVAASVKGLSDRIEGLKEQMDRVGDVSKFQGKALLAIRFGEVCKRLQEEFDKSLGQIDPPSPQPGSTDGN